MITKYYHMFPFLFCKLPPPTHIAMRRRVVVGKSNVLF